MYDPGTPGKVIRLHRWRVAAAASGMLAVWLATAVVWPRCVETAGRWRAWQAQQEQLSSVADWEVEQTNIAARRLYLEQYRGSLYVNLPRSEQMSVILQTLQRYAEGPGVGLEEVRQGERVAHEAYDELPVEVLLRGSFHGVGTFVDQVERSPYLVKVQSADIEVEPAARPGLRARLWLKVIIPKEHGAL